MESGSGSKPNNHGNFVAFKNASRVFLNGLFWLIECFRNISNRIFVPGGQGGSLGGGGRGARDRDGRFEYKNEVSKIFQRQRIK